MKKFLAGILVLFVLAIAVPLTVNAQRCERPRQRNYNGSNNNNYRNAYNRNYRQRSFYQRNRGVINTAAGAGAGALIGGIVKGKKGAVIGALIGGGSSALYTYKTRRNRNR